MKDNVDDLVLPSVFYTGDGLWSGCEGRHRKHYVALIPCSRYHDCEEQKKRLLVDLTIRLTGNHNDSAKGFQKLIKSFTTKKQPKPKRKTYKSTIRKMNARHGRILDIKNVTMPDWLEPDGLMKLLPAKQLDQTPVNDMLYFCYMTARHLLPTEELVKWLWDIIGTRTRKTIEIGAGYGDLGRHMGIPATDGCVQELPEVRAMYQSMGQNTIVYPQWIERLMADEAIKQYKPEVVIGSWITRWIDPNKLPPPGGGSIYGVKEEDIVSAGIKYILIGNQLIHRHKPIMQLPHQEHQLKFLRSRASVPAADRVWIWN